MSKDTGRATAAAAEREGVTIDVTPLLRAYDGTPIKLGGADSPDMTVRDAIVLSLSSSADLDGPAKLIRGRLAQRVQDEDKPTFQLGELTLIEQASGEALSVVAHTKLTDYLQALEHRQGDG